MPASIDLIPAELLLAIIECFVTPAHFNLVGRTIFFAHEEILPLSQVNHQLRHLCLPQLYKHIVIVVSNADAVQSRARQMELFGRIMERNPHLSELVRYVDIHHSTCDVGTYKLDALAFLPNLSEIRFPESFAPCPHLTSILASHPQLAAVKWDYMGDAWFRILLSFPADARSRVHMNTAMVILEDDDVYSFAGHISVQSLTLHQVGRPQEFSLTFSNLSRLSIQVHNSCSSQPLLWYPAFMERHLRLTSIEVGVFRCEHALRWQAFKEVPLLTPLCDAAHQRRLLLSFAPVALTLGRQAVTSDRFELSLAEFEVESAAMDVIPCIGSSMPVSRTLVLKFTTRRVSPLSVNHIVSVFHQSLPDQARLCIYNISLVLSAHRCNLFRKRDGTDTVQVTDFARLLASGMPKLEHVFFSEESRRWHFSVGRDEQGGVQIVNDNDLSIAGR